MPEETLKQVVDRVKAAIPAIGNAITNKGGTVSAGDGLEDFAADIATIPSGGIEPANPKDVNFYDYDGTCVYSYTADEFAELTAMPANPSHAGLTAQGWNWSLADAKQYVADYGKLIIGQMYITSDGKTRIYITLPEGRTNPDFQLYLNANSELDIDWGDGSTHSTFTSTTADYKSERHVYASAGDYVIAITVVSGSFTFKSTSSQSMLLSDGNNAQNSSDYVYRNAIKKIEIGAGITVIDTYAFPYCQAMNTITMPNTITSINRQSMYRCFGITYLTIPDSVTFVGYASFGFCQAITTISLPNSLVTYDSEYFNGCIILQYVTPPFGFDFRARQFNGCNSLSEITIPDGTDKLIGFCFAYCYSLASITLPDSITEIQNNVFDNAKSLTYIKFNPTSPPTITNINAWNNINTDYYILVPLNTLDDYLNETNMPDDSVYLYLCYAKYANGAELPATSTDGYSLTWYATKDDARAGTNPITVGNGKEVYAVGV